LHAVLEDEATTYNGRAAIGAWGADALIAHNTTVSVQKVTPSNDGKLFLEVIMDGDFKESHGITDPFTLYMTFTTASSIIQSLLITDLDPSAPSMFAVWASKGNLHDPLSSVRLGQRPVPTVPKGWVKVKVTAAGLNQHDIFTLMGTSGSPSHPLTFPLILGCEATGTLEDGTPVLLYPVMTSPTPSHYQGDITLDPGRHFLGEQTQGTLASYVIVPRSNAIPRPPNLPAHAAACLGVSWLTAYRMLFSRSGLRLGQTMLVQGSSGGVATALIQLGAAAGMRVWSTGRSVAKRELALKLGAERVFGPGEELPEHVDAVFDVAGKETWAHSMRCVRPGGDGGE
jgi:NADPH:quinone reductase-like Zn-dependent oxidoreductase